MNRTFTTLAKTTLLKSIAFGAAAFLAAPALAQNANVQVQTGLICDTVDQAVKVSRLVGKGDVRQALMTVNLEAAKPTACGVAEIAFIPDEEVAEVRNEFGARAFRVIRITVVGIKGPNGFQRVAPMEQFALIRERTLEA